MSDLGLTARSLFSTSLSEVGPDTDLHHHHHQQQQQQLNGVHGESRTACPSIYQSNNRSVSACVIPRSFQARRFTHAHSAELKVAQAPLQAENQKAGKIRTPETRPDPLRARAQRGPGPVGGTRSAGEQTE